MDETEKQPLSERLLPRGTTRRQTARVGSQMAKDGRAYLSRLKTLWSVSEDHDDTGDPTANYGTWQADHRAAPDDLARQRSWAENHPEAAPIEVVIDIADVAEGVDGAAFSATMASITAQTYGSWRAVQIGEWVPTPDPRLIGVDDITDAVTLGDPNAIVLFVEAGDTLEPEAFFQLAARAWDNPTVDLFTWDDDVRSPVSAKADVGTDPLFRAGWSPEALLSRDPVGRAFGVRRRLFFDPESPSRPSDEKARPVSAQDHRAHLSINPPDRTLGDTRWWDLLLRLDIDPERASHLPRVLSHLNRRPTPTALEGAPLVQRHIDRRGISAVVTVDREAVRLRWRIQDRPRASILIPTRHNRALLAPCLASLARTDYPDFEVIIIDNGEQTPENVTWYHDQRLRLGLDLQVNWWAAPFNFSAVNNEAARLATGDVFVFLNDDTEALGPDWLDELVGWAIQPNIGLVGTHLLGPDGTLQHAGVVVGMGGYADHVFEGSELDTNTLAGPTRTYRNFLAVTCACAAMSRAKFESLGGYDERFELCGSDVKLGLDATLRGWRTLCTPFASVAHKESATRGTSVPTKDFFTSWWPYQRWLRAGDPYYSPNLSMWSRTPRLRAAGEPSPLERVGEIIHRPLAPKRGTFEWDDDTHARWLVQRCNADDAVVAAVHALHTEHRGPRPPATLSWWLPDLESPFYGGINTTLRLADFLARRHGVTNSFVVAADENELFVRSAIAAAFPALAQTTITFIDDPADLHRAPAVDVAIATLWETAYLVARSPNALRKAYLVQDYEPGFYPAGTKAALAEESYRLGLYGIANTEPVLNQLKTRSDTPAIAFKPTVDRTVFHPNDRRRVDHPIRAGQPITVFVYARPGHPRNCWELAAPALAEVKRRFGNDIHIVTAGSWATPDDLGGGIEHLGFLDYESTGDLYRRCDLGLTLQVSEHPSYLPIELLACGVPVVAFDHPGGDWLLRHDHNSIRCRRTLDGLVEALTELITNDTLRGRLGAQGAKDIEAFGSWDDAFAGVYPFLTDPETHSGTDAAAR